MSLGLSRALLRRQFLSSTRRTAYRRSASSASEAAGSVAKAAGDAASTAQAKVAPVASKASEGLSKVASQAGGYASKAGAAAGRMLGGIGGTTGRVIGAVQGLIPPAIYYSRVGLELGKFVFNQRKMSPPSVQTFQQYWSNIINYVRSPSSVSSAASAVASSPSTLLNSIRNADRQTLAALGIVGAEVLGFFTVGEMIGRLKIVGYRSSAQNHNGH